MTGEKARVSAVIPCFRCGSTLRRAVESVRRQTLPVSEVILVDDRSGDDTIDVMRSLQSELGAECVKVIEHSRNGGPGAARNSGWDVATQEYVAFLDADDVWHPRKIEIQFSWMASNPRVALSGHLTRKIANDGGIGEIATMPNAQPVPARQLLWSNRFPTRTVMLRRDLPLRFEPQHRYAEDYGLWLRLAYEGYQLWTLPAPLAFSFKEDFGEQGLSASLWRMERGELDALVMLFRCEKISAVELMGSYGWSLLRFVRRLALSGLRTRA